MEEIQTAYNEAIIDQMLQIGFKAIYRPIILELANESELMEDPIRISPAFKSCDSGSYYAIRITDTTRYIVVPKFGMKFNQEMFSSGGMNLVFKRTPPFDSERTYERYQLTYPALLVEEGDIFRIDESNRGGLLLDDGERGE